MDLEFSNRFLISTNYFILGNEDEYMSIDKGKGMVSILNDAKMEFQFVKFNGKHNIDSKTLLHLV